MLRKCWLPDNSGCASVLSPCLGHWVQMQLVLPTSTGMCIASACFSQLMSVPATTWFLPSPGWALQWIRCVPDLSGFFSLLTILVHSHLPTFRCFNVQISHMCLCIEQGILCWMVAVQITETSRGQGELSCHQSSEHHSLFELFWVNFCTSYEIPKFFICEYQFFQLLKYL